jgi:hypothetical protein
VSGIPTARACKPPAVSSSMWGRVLHTVESFIFRSLMKNLTAQFATPSPRVCLMVLLNALLLPRCSCSFRAYAVVAFWSLQSSLLDDFYDCGLYTLQGQHSPCCLTASHWFPGRSFTAPTISTVASSLGTFWCYSTVSISFGFASKSEMFISSI